MSMFLNMIIKLYIKIYDLKKLVSGICKMATTGGHLEWFHLNKFTIYPRKQYKMHPVKDMLIY